MRFWRPKVSPEEAKRRRAEAERAKQAAEQGLQDAAQRWQRFHSALAHPLPSAPQAPANPSDEANEQYRRETREWTRDMWSHVQDLSARAHKSILSGAFARDGAHAALQEKRRHVEAILGPRAGPLIDEALAASEEDALAMCVEAGLLQTRGISGRGPFIESQAKHP